MARRRPVPLGRAPRLAPTDQGQLLLREVATDLEPVPLQAAVTDPAMVPRLEADTALATAAMGQGTVAKGAVMTPATAAMGQVTEAAMAQVTGAKEAVTDPATVGQGEVTARAMAVRVAATAPATAGLVTTMVPTTEMTATVLPGAAVSTP